MQNVSVPLELNKRTCCGCLEFIINNLVAQSIFVGISNSTVNFGYWIKLGSVSSTPGLDHIFNRLGPALPTPPSLPSLPTHTCVKTPPCGEPM